MMRWSQKLVSPAPTMKRAALGSRHVGDGAFAHVIAHPSKKDRVIKLVTKEDTAYIEYITYLNRHNVTNPCFPMIYSVEWSIPQRGGEYYRVEMERLKPLTWYRNFRGIDNAPWALDDEDPIDSLMLGIDDMIDGLGSSEADIAYKYLTTPERRAIEILTNIRRLPDIDSDITVNNVMLRGSTLVFTDPFCCAYDDGLNSAIPA